MPVRKRACPGTDCPASDLVPFSNRSRIYSGSCLPRPMSTIVPTIALTIFLRNLFASIVNLSSLHFTAGSLPRPDCVAIGPSHRFAAGQRSASAQIDIPGPSVRPGVASGFTESILMLSARAEGLKPAVARGSVNDLPLTYRSLTFTIEANRFLRNMVRAIVGTMVDIGRGKHEPEYILELLEKGTRSDAGQSVPGHALFLTGIKY